MPQTAKEFLNQWLNDHIKPMEYQHHKEVAKGYTLLCRASAEREGITSSELDSAAGGKLEKRILSALEDAKNAAVKARKPKI